MARVLLIEDNPANMKLATFLLQSAGHTVIGTRTAEAGLVLAREQHPELILMDIQLPGMDGIQAIGLLKQAEGTRAIPIIALTVQTLKGDEARIRAAGADGYIAKPIRHQQFLSAVAEQLVTRGASLIARG
jgi:two-component system cell cycle response regulator DivK